MSTIRHWTGLNCVFKLNGSFQRLHPAARVSVDQPSLCGGQITGVLVVSAPSLTGTLSKRSRFRSRARPWQIACSPVVFEVEIIWKALRRRQNGWFSEKRCHHHPRSSSAPPNLFDLPPRRCLDARHRARSGIDWQLSSFPWRGRARSTHVARATKQVPSHVQLLA